MTAISWRAGATLAFLVIATAGAAWLGTDLVMAPSGAERQSLIAMYVAIAAAVFVVGISLLQLTRRSLSRRVLVLSLAGPLVVGVITIIGAWSMFISSHDTQFVVILVAAAMALAAGLVHLLIGPLVGDLERLTVMASKVGAGDLGIRAELDRPDELGALGAAFDSMASRIEQAAADREQVAAQRQFMLASLSHDARTPLTAIRAALEALQDGLAPDPDRYLESISYDLRAIESIIENIFIIGKLDADQLDPFIEQIDLTEVASDAVAAIEPLARKNEAEVSVVAAGPVAAIGARIETERMISNLLSNAIRHSPPTGRVKVVVSDVPQPTLAVLDEGPGFAPEFLDRAFEQFERSGSARDRAQGGAGLGLAVVRGLAEAQGGRAWAEPGPGGQVIFELPTG